MSKTIRGIDDEVFREFKAEAQKEGKTVGDAVNEAMLNWLSRSGGEGSLDDMNAFDWGEDSEKLSTKFEEELYG
ncbi:MAG: hypothetical protein ABEK16_01745 [Candidatus Nanohalobium sp.]